MTTREALHQLVDTRGAADSCETLSEKVASVSGSYRHAEAEKSPTPPRAQADEAPRHRATGHVRSAG